MSQSAPVPAPSAAAARENRDPLLDPPLLPKAQITLIGAVVLRLDEVMNRMVVQPFGGKQKMKIAFDTRTHFYSDGKAISERQLKEGQRIYLDTMLNGSTVFAKTIWIQNSIDSGISRGQIVHLDTKQNTLTIRDEISDQPVRMQLTPETVFRKNNQPGSAQDLREGALVSVTFGPKRELREIELLAAPGSTFVFSGRIAYLDLSRKMLAIDNRTDRNKYDISIEAVPASLLRQLHEGDDATVSAVFDGNGYAARRIDLPASRNPQP